MKTSAIIILFGVLASLSRAGVIAEIPPVQQVILPGVWTPSPEETGRALQAAQAFLQNPEGRNAWTQKQVGDILAHGSVYRVQFIGLDEEGRRIIRCNFFPAGREGEPERFPDWKEQVVEVLDGGFWFWQIDYDVESGACRNLSVNGEA
ncbi:MAG: hypothetical protein KJ726_09005 [Verrucomicrobia bacterium]|nr:hypothetical protein [Verrucomicrobiota bacterium]MBU1910174.1 hypothetical protein [Verrucomicrobiota bacterium]